MTVELKILLAAGILVFLAAYPIWISLLDKIAASVSGAIFGKPKPQPSVCPGEYLLKWLTLHDMTAYEFAAKSGLDEDDVFFVFNCDKYIDAKAAAHLERGTGIPADVWVGMQERWDNRLTA